MTTVGLPDTFTYTTIELASCLLVSSACAYGSQVRFIRSASATRLVTCALNPQDQPSSSSLTSTNVSLLTSPQPENRKVSLTSADVGAVHHLRMHAMGSEH